MKLSANKTLVHSSFLLCIAARRVESFNIIDEVKITATASLSGGYTKMIYEDWNAKT